MPITKHQKRSIIVAISSLILFTSSLSSVLASSLPFAIETVCCINHLYSKVSTINRHIKHLEGHLLSISGWSISNINCSSCWNISSNIKSIFSKMAAAPSTEASQQMDVTENEEQQVIEDHHSAEVEAPTSPERAASISDLKPPINNIKTEKEAKIHIIDAIIYDTMSSDASYHTPPSETISKIYDSFGPIMADGLDLTSMTSDYTLITLVDFMKQASVTNHPHHGTCLIRQTPSACSQCLTTSTTRSSSEQRASSWRALTSQCPTFIVILTFFNHHWQPSTSASLITRFIASAGSQRTISLWSSSI